MTPQITDDEVGKRVVDANGEEIGMVTAVEGGTAYVEPDPGVTDSIKATLGWEDAGEDAFALESTAVETVAGDEIRLSGRERSRGGSATHADEGVVDRDEGAGRRDVGAESGDIGESDADREPARTEPGASNAAERDPGSGSEFGADETPDSVAGSEPDLGSEPDQEMGRGADERSTATDSRSDRDLEGARDRSGAETDPDAGMRRDDAEVEPGRESRRDDASVEPTEGGRRTDAEIEPTGDPERTDAEMDPEEVGRSDGESDDDREDTVTDAKGRDEDR